MASEVLSPGTVVNDSSFGDVAWGAGTLNNCKVSDDSYTTVSVGAIIPNSNYLKPTNYASTIPDGSTGITVVLNLERSGGSNLKDARIRLVVGGVIGSTEYKVVGNWPGTDAVQAYDFSAENPTPAQIRASDFGVAIAVEWVSGSAPQAKVDHAPLTISWTAPSGGSIRRRQVRRLTEHSELDTY